jgi:hypothetical protein
MSSAALRGHIRMRIILGDLISPTASSTFAAAASPRADIQFHGTKESRPAHTLALTAPWEVDR